MACIRVVSCVSLGPGPLPDQVLEIGGVHPDGRLWSLSVGAAIDGIERDEWRFVIQTDLEVHQVTVETLPTGERYLSAKQLALSHFFPLATQACLSRKATTWEPSGAGA